MKTIFKTLIIYNLAFTVISLSFGEGWGEASAQNIGINGTGGNAHPSALLDIDAVATPSLGLLIPRIALQAINLSAPVTSPATSLLVFNTATASTGTNAVSSGYYYWDGAKWVRFQMSNSGSSSNAWDLLGNAGTVDGTNFIGTTDNIPFNIRVNNQKSGRIDPILQNVFYGYQTGNSITTGSNNVAFGDEALKANTTGRYNTASGYVALTANTSGIANTANGAYALRNNSTGNYNTATGHEALYSNTGNYNVANGALALFSNTTGSVNTSIGMQSLAYNTTGSGNVASGGYALDTNLTGSRNVSVGAYSMRYNLNGNDNVANGYAALYNNLANFNTALGSYAGYANTTGSFNTAIGADALKSNTTASGNTAVGYQSLFVNTIGFNNTANGVSSLYNNASGNYNTAMGYNSLNGNTTGNNNVAVGNAAALANTTGSQNTAIGSTALLSNTIGTHNSALSYQALFSNTSGSFNTAVGADALKLNTTASENTAVGYQALLSNNTGSNNVALGHWAGYLNTTGFNNTFLGAFSDATSGTYTNATAIGYNAKVGASNALILGGTGSDAVNVGIGTTNPARFFHSKSITNTNGLFEYVNASTSISNGYGLLIQNNDQTNGNYVSIIFGGHASSTGTGWAGIASKITDRASGSEDADIAFWTKDAGASSEKMVIKNTGNVGIGTTSPTQKLDVIGNIKFSNALMPNNLAGNSGDVLVSQGAGVAPVWSNPSSLGGGPKYLASATIIPNGGFGWNTYNASSSIPVGASAVIIEYEVTNASGQGAGGIITSSISFRKDASSIVLTPIKDSSGENETNTVYGGHCTIPVSSSRTFEFSPALGHIVNYNLKIVGYY